MARSSWVLCEKRGKLIPKDEYYGAPPERGVLVVGDLPDMVSTVDGRIIHGRAGMRRHNKELGVTFTEDFKGEWAQAARQRELFFEGKSDKKARTQAVVDAYERVRSGYKPRRPEPGEFNK